MSVHSYTTSAKNRQQQQTGVPEGRFDFEQDGVECHAHMPSEIEIAFVLAETARRQPLAIKIAAVINFFTAVLDEKTEEYLIPRLLDPTDDFGIEDVEQIMKDMLEEWTGNPTDGLSVSTEKPTPSGPSSTDAQHVPV